jgi:hypothetical protein
MHVFKPMKFNKFVVLANQAKNNYLKKLSLFQKYVPTMPKA